MSRILVTGAAGFVGLYVSKLLLARGDQVIGLDNLNSYYDPRLKEARLEQLVGLSGFSFVQLDLSDREGIATLFDRERPELVVHLGAQAGVRYSLENPAAYVEANLVGFGNMLEGCRQTGVKHLVFASSSSVYGANTKVPFSVHDNVDHPISFYAATKKANELMAHSYSHLYRLPVTGLRFFTVYGPWGRPDMAYFSFTKAILEGKPIDVYNHGRSRRDFTYIDDIAEGVVRCLDLIPEADPGWDSDAADPGTSSAPYRVYNIGNNNPVELGYFIEVIEKATGREAIKRYTEAQAGDVPATYADIADLEAAIGFRPRTSIEDGIGRFVAWYRDFYGV
jgi:UDP-glucuronate 4-epimerase